jgi:hypothetical protein
MDFVKVLTSWKMIVGSIAAVVVATVSLLAWGADQMEQQKVVIAAQAALVHNDFYQEGRIARKEDQIMEHTRQLDSMLYLIGNDSPTTREERQIEYLDNEIVRLRHEIEEIRVSLDEDG